MPSLDKRSRYLARWRKAPVSIFLVAFLATVSLTTTSESSASGLTIADGREAQGSSLVTPPTIPSSNAGTPKAEASSGPTPQSPIEFRFSALRDLTDMRKDIKDARSGIDKNGLGKFYWNVVEIEFNLVQLESLVPRKEYATNWNKNLQKLKSAVNELSKDDPNLTISSAKKKLDKVLQAIPALEKIAKSLAN